MIIKRDKPGLAPRLTPSDLDIAWAAGFYEGEGSCSRSGERGRSFVVSIAQKDPECLYRIRDLFGGSVKEYKNDRGNLATNGQGFTIYAWRVCGDKARIFVAVIYSMLSARRKMQIDSTPLRAFLNFVGSVPLVGMYVFVQEKLSHHVDIQLALRAEERRKYDREWKKAKRAAAKVVSIA